MLCQTLFFSFENNIYKLRALYELPEMLEEWLANQLVDLSAQLHMLCSLGQAGRRATGVTRHKSKSMRGEESPESGVGAFLSTEGPSGQVADIS